MVSRKHANPVVRAKSQGEIRDKMVGVYVNADEYAMWKAAAEADGLSRLGSWVRVAVNDYLDGKPPKVENPADQQVLLGLSRIGNNLNQLVRLAHAEGFSKIADEADVFLDQIDAICARFQEG